ncbi:MAG: response regulator [Spirochaetaceae bacterium]
MYKILIADDEEIIRRGFENKIDWTELGFEFLPSCKNGAELLEKVKKFEPDVVLTDICMPEVDGLEAATIIAQEYPSIVILILSGYDEFDYAQKAIQNRVYEYILKPINRKELKVLLIKLKEKLDKDRETADAWENLKSIEIQNKSLLVRQFLTSIIFGHTDNHEIDNFTNTYGGHYKKLAFAVMVLQPDTFDSNETLPEGMSLPLFLLAIKNEVEDLYVGKKGMDIFFSPRGRLILLLSDLNPAQLSLDIRSLPDRILEKVEEIPGCTITIGVGKVHKKLESIPRSYNESLNALQHRFIYGRGSIIYYVEKQFNSSDVSYDLNKRLEILLERFASGSIEQGKEDILKYMDILVGLNLPIDRIEMETRKLFLSVLNLLENMDFLSSLTVMDRDLLQLKSDLPTMEGSKDLLNRILSVIFENLKGKRQDFSGQKIIEARRFIENAYSEKELTIDQVSQELYISSGYLSRIFKKHTGKTFISYLTDYRIETAKSLLRSSNLKSYEIAEKVGYKDPLYFSTVFKKITGQTLSTYKKSLDEAN